MAERQMRGSDVFTVSVIAAVAGVIAGMLLAPRKGSETRQMMGQKAENWKGKAGDRMDSIRQKTQHMKDKAQDKLQRKSEEAADSMEAQAEQLKREQGQVQSPVLTNWEEEV